MPPVIAANVPCDPGSRLSAFTVQKLPVRACWVSVRCYRPASSPSTRCPRGIAWLRGFALLQLTAWADGAKLLALAFTGMGEVCLSNIQDPINLIDVIVKKKESMLHTVERQPMIGSSLSLEKMAAFLTMPTCVIIRNSAVAEIYSLNIINNTALAAGLQTSCWGTRKNKITAFRVSCSLSRYWG